MINTRKILKRLWLRILPILLIFITRSRVLADMAWDPPPDPDSAGDSSVWLIRVILICVIASVWLFAKARMLKHYHWSGWDILIPFYGRYLEYKYYWDWIYYWVSTAVWIYILIVLVAVWGKYKEILMIAGLLAWVVITVLMRMKTMEAFGQKKLLGLLELLGLGFVLDCICALACRRIEAEWELKRKLVQQQEQAISQAYQQAKQLMTESGRKYKLEKAISLLELIQGYEDSEELLQQCRCKVQEIVEAELRKKAEREAGKKKRTLLILRIAFGIAAAALIISMILLHNYRERQFPIQTAMAISYETKTIQAQLIETAMVSAATPVPAEGITPAAEKTLIPAGIKTGDVISFGRYEQDDRSGADDIEWIVLTVEDNRALVISRYALETRLYNEIRADVTWETCTLRTWLNGDFCNNAFTDSEKAMIQEVWNSNPKNPKHRIKGGNDTLDKIFLLSIDEVEKYMPSNSSRQCEATLHAKQTGAYVHYQSGYSGWWLRSPGSDKKRAALVSERGNVDLLGSGKPVLYYVVRPALWLNL